jgi:hypothetical protein
MTIATFVVAFAFASITLGGSAASRHRHTSRTVLGAPGSAHGDSGRENLPKS